MTAGAVRFARYAYPPNALGYCGPEDHVALFEHGTAGVSDGGLRALARDFEGAWPYLELIGGAVGLDPLDDEVVEAYWLGNRLLDRVDMATFGNSMEDRFRSRAGRSWDAVRDGIVSGVRPNHSYHVFCVYPWVGLMRTGLSDEPLHVLDQCRIRWGRVLSVEVDLAEVESRPLVLENNRLAIGPRRTESVIWANDGHGFAEKLTPGTAVAMHWGWICERLGASAVRALGRETSTALDLANRFLARPRTGLFA